MEPGQPQQPFAAQHWMCVCEECAINRQGKPPTAALLAEYADRLAERTRLGPQPEKPTKRVKDVALDNEGF